MKKTTKIHLVLVTAVLTSCNRMMIPDQPDPGYTPDPGMGLIPDSSLTAGPVYRGNSYRENGSVGNSYDENGYAQNSYGENSYDGNCRIDTVYCNNLDFYFNYYYPGYSYGYRFDYLYRRAMYWRNRLITIRGGFGKAAASSAS